MALQGSLSPNYTKPNKPKTRSMHRSLENSRKMGERTRGTPRRIHLGGEGSKREEEPKHQLLILSCIEGAKRAMPLAVEQAHAIPIEDVQHVGVVPRQPRQRPRWRRRSRTRLHRRRSPKELHLSRVRRCVSMDLRSHDSENGKKIYIIKRK